MARHKLPAKDPDHTVTIWWDTDMSTFVGVVRQSDGKRRKLIVVDTVSDLRARLRPYAEFDHKAWSILLNDRGSQR